MVSYNSIFKFAFKITNITCFLQKYTEVSKIPNISRQIYKKVILFFDFLRIIRILHRYR